MNINNNLPADYKGFLYRKRNNTLILNSNNFDKAVKIMIKDKIKNLEINSNFLKNRDLNYINKFSFIEGLTLLSPLIEDVSPINELTDLKSLIIENKLKGEIDFKNFDKIENCHLVWGISGCESIYNAISLDKLKIYNYNKFELFELLNLKQLSALSLINSKIVNIQGISKLINLNRLEFTGCSKIEDISELSKLFKLKELCLDRCKSLNSIEPIKNILTLRRLSFNNIGNVDTINYLSNLIKLEEIYFTDNTNIQDGDLNCLKILHQKNKLKKIIFLNRRHYSHKKEELGYKEPDIVANIFRKK